MHAPNLARIMNLAQRGPEELIAQRQDDEADELRYEVDPTLSTAAIPTVQGALNQLSEGLRNTFPESEIERLLQLAPPVGEGAEDEENSLDETVETLLEVWLTPQSARVLNVLTPALLAAARAAYQAARQAWREQFGGEAGTDPEFPGDLQDWAGQQAAAILDDIRQDLRRRIRDIIREGRQQGLSPREIAQRIREALGLYEPAQRAANEAHRAVHHGAHRFFKKFPGTRKHWLTRQDDRVCGICRKNQECPPLPLSKHFPSGHEYPPAHPNCRCSIGYSARTPRGIVQWTE